MARRTVVRGELRSIMGGAVYSIVHSIFKEMKIDEASVNRNDRHTSEFKEGFKEAIRNLKIIIKQETEVDVSN